ncbi:MAG: helix-turn-helix domain-containing protein [Bacteroidales bacterium]
MIHRTLVFLVFLSAILSTQVYGSANSFTDTTVESLMNHFMYREAGAEINRKLKTTSGKEVDRQLYYHNKLSLAQLRLRNIDSALAMAKLSLSLIPRSKDSVLIADAWRVLSYSYNNAGNLDSALVYTRFMLGYAERKGDLRMMRNSLSSMASIMNQNRQYDNALNYYRQAAALTTKIHDTLNYALSFYNIGLTFLNMYQNDSCLFYMNLAMKKAITTKQIDLLVYIYGSLADHYLNTGNEKERKKYLLLATNEAEKIGNNQFLAMLSSNLMQGALETKNYREAIQYGEKALLCLRIQPYPVLQMRVDSMSWLAYKGTGNLPLAMEYLVSFYKEKDELVSRQQKEQLDKMTLTLDVKEKDLTIAHQNLDISNNKRRIEVLTLFAIIAVLLIVTLFVFILRARAFRRQLFRKEKELDQFAGDVRNWMEWKKEHQESGDKKEEDENILPDEPLDEIQLQATLFTELRDAFDKQKLYLDPELHLKAVIQILGTNKKYLYKAINDNTDANFRAFINRYRIDEAKRIMENGMQNNEQINLSEMYASAGFKSSASFYRVFKQVTGLAPRDYIRELKAAMKNPGQAQF